MSTINIEQQPPDGVYKGHFAVVWRNEAGELESMRLATDSEVILGQILSVLNDIKTSLVQADSQP